MAIVAMLLFLTATISADPVPMKDGFATVYYEEVVIPVYPFDCAKLEACFAAAGYVYSSFQCEAVPPPSPNAYSIILNEPRCQPHGTPSAQTIVAGCRYAP